MKNLQLEMVGQGEVVSVSGKNILSWQVNNSMLEIILSEVIDREALISVTTQSMLDSL